MQETLVFRRSEGEEQMLRNLKDLQDYAIRASDGAIGHVKDFYIDDQAWVIRYFVVETGSWLSSRKVLISPISIGHPDWPGKELSVSITREQVKNSPDIDTEKPVSRQHEIDYLGYYAYPVYWGGPGLWGAGTHPNLMMPEFVSTPSVVQPQVDNILADAPASRHHGGDPHLRSCNMMFSYHIHATDGELGHVQGLLVDEQTWAIRYIIVNTSNWWLGHQVLIAPQWIKDVSWIEGMVSLNLTRQKIKDAPPYDPANQVNRTHEVSIYKHYGNMAYWVNEQKPDAPRAASPR
jgi:PRC-barrel domain